jgi:2'-5' RNA ligase
VRVFVAVDVGDAVRREAARVITALTGKLDAATKPPKVTWVKPAAMHVTIKFIGEVDAARADALASLLEPPFQIRPFDVQWRGIGSFPNNKQPRALWLGVTAGASALAAIEAEVSRRFAGSGAIEIEGRPLLPHLTLGRVKMAGEGVDWPRILQACEVKQVVTRVERVVLFESTLSQQGPHYTELIGSRLVG